MTTISITKNQMIIDINDKLCFRLEAMTFGFAEPFDYKPNRVLVRDWKYPNMGDLVKTDNNGIVILGCPGTLYNHGWHYHDRPVCHPWLQEQEDKYPGFIEKVWMNIKGI